MKLSSILNALKKENVAVINKNENTTKMPFYVAEFHDTYLSFIPEGEEVSAIRVGRKEAVAYDSHQQVDSGSYHYTIKHAIHAAKR